MVRDMLDYVLSLTELVTMTMGGGRGLCSLSTCGLVAGAAWGTKPLPLVNMTRNMDGLPPGVSVDSILS